MIIHPGNLAFWRSVFAADSDILHQRARVWFWYLVILLPAIINQEGRKRKLWPLGGYRISKEIVKTRKIYFRQRRPSQCFAKRKLWPRTESTNWSRHLSLGVPAWGKRGGEGCTLGWSRCCGASYVLSEGGGGWPPIMPVICITSLPLPWSPAYSPIVSELLHIITTNYPQQLNNLPLMHLGEYSGGWVVGVGLVGGLSFPGLSLPDSSNLSAFCASNQSKSAPSHTCTLMGAISCK